jgi:[ribosomal protein S5]-alanine N-acetyltransferase
MTTLHGRRVALRALVPEDFGQFAEVRNRNVEWLTKWEPSRLAGQPDPACSYDAFVARCSMRQRERQLGTGYGFGIFCDKALVGEINLSSVQRGAFQSGHVGYWMDEARAGNGYTPEAVIVLCRYAFEDLALHRVQISIIPRNRASRRVVEKLGLRDEGIAERYLQINGRWEDHVRYALTVEEWTSRAADLAQGWL